MTEKFDCGKDNLASKCTYVKKLCCYENLDCKADGICSNVSVLSEYLSSAFHNFSRH